MTDVILALTALAALVGIIALLHIWLFIEVHMIRRRLEHMINRMFLGGK
jgi:hypothetical protein